MASVKTQEDLLGWVPVSASDKIPGDVYEARLNLLSPDDREKMDAEFKSGRDPIFKYLYFGGDMFGSFYDNASATLTRCVYVGCDRETSLRLFAASGYGPKTQEKEIPDMLDEAVAFVDEFRVEMSMMNSHPVRHTKFRYTTHGGAKFRALPPGEKTAPKGDRVFCTTSDGSTVLTLPKDALVEIRESEVSLRAPSGKGLDGFTYSVKRSDVKRTDAEKGRLHVKLPKDGTICLTKHGEGKEIPAGELVGALNTAADGDFLPLSYEVEVPRSAVCSESASGVRFRMPDKSGFAGGFVTATEAFVNKDKSDDEKIVLSVPEEKTLTVRTRGGDSVVLSAEKFADAMSDATYDARKKWVSFTIPKEALVKRYERSALIKLPFDGTYDDFACYLPDGMVDDSKAGDTDGCVKITVPKDMGVEIRSLQGERRKVTTAEFYGIVTGKPGDLFRRPRREKQENGKQKPARQQADDFPAL